MTKLCPPQGIPLWRDPLGMVVTGTFRFRHELRRSVHVLAMISLQLFKQGMLSSEGFERPHGSQGCMRIVWPSMLAEGFFPKELGVGERNFSEPSSTGWMI